MTTNEQNLAVVVAVAAAAATEQHQQETNARNTNSKRQRRMLSWRMDPAESFSDFIIEIVVLGQDGSSSNDNNKEETVSSTYHVHKASLAFGEKSSGYFDALFASETTESLDNKTRIRLKFEPAAKTFPMLLDYIYGLDDGKPKLSMENSAPLYHLADYFEIESLHQNILEFWTENMLVDDLATCLQQAATFRIDSLRDAVVNKCAKEIVGVALDSPLLEVSDSKFWVDVYAEAKVCSPLGVDVNFDTVVTEFCFQRKNDLNAETFKELTGLFVKGRPLDLTFDTAVTLLELEKVVEPEASLGNDGLTELQGCVLETLSCSWERWVDSTILQTSLEKISPLLFSRAMAMSLKLAREEKAALDFVVDNAAANLGSPTKLTLTGAGVTAANGVYLRRDAFDPSDPQYFLSGLWEGDPAIYVVVRVGVGPAHVPVWFLCVERAGCEDEELYASPVFTNKRLSCFPRMNGWRAWKDRNFDDDDDDDNNNDSQPTLLYHFD